MGSRFTKKPDKLRSLALIGRLEEAPKDVDSVVLTIELNHETGDDAHGHIVVEADEGTWDQHIDAFLKETSRPGWY